MHRVTQSCHRAPAPSGALQSCRPQEGDCPGTLSLLEEHRGPKTWGCWEASHGAHARTAGANAELFQACSEDKAS